MTKLKTTISIFVTTSDRIDDARTRGIRPKESPDGVINRALDALEKMDRGKKAYKKIYQKQ
jgi:hypothetical protein